MVWLRVGGWMVGGVLCSDVINTLNAETNKPL